ncbi:MAG: aryl-sulfate sulfotransferase [SAR324 cluster bacterium]|nr:aryl-sulfate sulfotransferase [SAR324 cluster bacterium]
MQGGLDQVTLRRRGCGLIGYDDAGSAGGYTLFAPNSAKGQVFLIDMEGTPVHSWKMPFPPGRHAVILPNGNLGYNGNHPDSPNIYIPWALWRGGAFSEVTPDGKVVWEHTDLTHHHDAQWLENGHLLYGTVSPMPKEIAQRVVGGSSLNVLEDGRIYGDVIKEVNRSGEIEWLWRSWEHMNPEDFPIHPIFERHHWPYINGLWHTRAGLVLMSLRTTSGVIGVDKSSGKIVFHIGPEIVSQQHAPVELENGNILIFDNGNLRVGNSTNASRVVEVNPNNNHIEWEYSDEMRIAFFSAYMGSAQRLKNGNTHITESATGRLFEVTREGKVVWEYVIPYFAEYVDEDVRKYVPGHHNSVFRSYRYSKDQIPWL